MRPRHLTASIVALLTAATLSIGGPAPAWAAPQRPAHTAARAVPAAREVSKIVLPETSVDGPALSSIVGVFEGVSFNKSVIGWTGTDAAHHLNVETSADGLHFGHKLTLDETSPFRPDVTQMSEPAGGAITVAWTGSDPNHLLNVLFDVYGHPTKLTLPHDNSGFAPAIVQMGATMFLAWTGTDANHSLNVLPITFTGTSLVSGHKTVLSQLSSSAGPHLALRGGNTLVLNWTTGALQLRLATSQDGVTFSPDLGVGLPETSAFAPHTTSFTSEGGPGDWIGWTGTDSGHHLNLQWTTSFPQFPNPAGTKTTLGETALGGPALAFNAGPQIAWTGTDAARHLNIAKFEFS